MYVAPVPVFKGQGGLRSLHTSVFLKGTQIPPTYPAMASVNEEIVSPIHYIVCNGYSICKNYTTDLWWW